MLLAGCTFAPSHASPTTTAARTAGGSSPNSIEVLPTIGTATLVPTTTRPGTRSSSPAPATTAHPPRPATSTTSRPATTTSARPSDGAPLALDVLGFIAVRNEHRGGYVRDLFGYPTDVDHDGCNTRAEVLMRDSLVPVTHRAGRCTVATGRWVSRYDGVTGTSASEFAIDHVVALKEAWDSGAWAWSATTRFAYGNDLSDPRTLREVTVASNDAKGDKDPSNWLPSDPAGVCPYLADWVSIKVRWQLTMDPSEFGRIRNLLRGPCAGTRIAPWSPPPVPVPTPS